MSHILSRTALALITTLALAGHAAESGRQAEVARRGADVMPFSLEATTHIFSKTADGTQRRGEESWRWQVRLVREHLRDIETQFRKGDFRARPIHGARCRAGAARAAKPTNVDCIQERPRRRGAALNRQIPFGSLRCTPGSTQVSDHGADAMAGHPHHSGSHKQ
jgi:hypothetical protein